MSVCVDGCVSDLFDWLRRSKAISAIRLKRRAGASMSQHARKKAGLVLSPIEEKLLAGQVNVLCVYAHVMTVVCVGAGVDGQLCSLDTWRVIHSSTIGCDRLDAANRAHSQRLKTLNFTTNLRSIENNTEIAKTSKMTIGISDCVMMCIQINVLSTDHHYA